MNSKKWSWTTVLIVGAAAGFTVGLYSVLTDEAGAQVAPYSVGYLMGSVLGGMLLATIVAVVRNAFVN